MIKRINSRKEQEGFTLIELLVVIVVLGILAGVVVFAVGNITDRGTNSACKSDFKSIEVAQEAKFAKDKVYAASVGALVTANYLRDTPPADFKITTDTTGKVLVDGTADTSKCPS